MEPNQAVHCELQGPVLCLCQACDDGRRERVMAFAANFSMRAYRNNVASKSNLPETLRPPAFRGDKPDRVWADSTDVFYTELQEWY
jgi:hypothetical protein